MSRPGCGVVVGKSCPAAHEDPDARRSVEDLDPIWDVLLLLK